MMSSSTHPVRVFAIEYSAQLINRGQCAQGPTIKRKTSAVCGGSDVSPCGGEKSETEV